MSWTDGFLKGEAGYYCIKIPSLLVTANNTLVAFGEGRLNSCSDFTETQLVTKRSVDGGRSWTALQVLHAEAGHVIGNAAPVVERSTGRVVLVFCRDNLEVLQTVSDDHGVSWSTPTLVTGVTDPAWTWVGTGPPSAIQMPSGRLVVPAYHSLTPDDDGEVSTGHTMLSDDGGATWRLGANYTHGLDFPNENQAVVLPDGRLFVHARGLLTARIGAVSSDGGESWDLVADLPGIDQPLGGCEGSTIYLPATNQLLYSGLAETSVYRYNLSLATVDAGAVTAGASGSGNETFGAWQWRQVLDVGPSAYTSLALLPEPGNATTGQAVGLLFERSNRTLIVFEPDAISFAVLDPPPALGGGD